MTLPSLPRLMIVGTLALALAGCGAAQRIADIGKAPDLKPVENVKAPPAERSLAVRLPDPLVTERTSGSLWRVGAKAFFKDQRANGVGDILTVVIEINDVAEMENETTRTRSNGEDASLNAFLGVPPNLGSLGIETAPAVGLTSDSTHAGVGEIEREEIITTSLAAMVVDVLPNGNFVIQGRQEVRINFEVRELLVAGIVRPQDISSVNTIAHTQIAEARISYGGRGQLTDVQQPRYGQQFYDIIFPF